jgi:hypothetical protein
VAKSPAQSPFFLLLEHSIALYSLVVTAREKTTKLSGIVCGLRSHLISIRKTMFLSVLDWGRAAEPNFETGRFIR